MFVQADVESKTTDGELRHFLAPRDAVYGKKGYKKVRLPQRKYKEIAHAGGILINTEHHIAALRSNRWSGR